MFVFAIFWIGALLHIALGHLAVLSAIGYVSRLWLLVPLVFYVVGFGLHLFSAHAARQEAAEIVARNARVRLEVEMPFRAAVSKGSDIQLLALYHVERLYTLQSIGSVTEFYHAKGADCEGVKEYRDHQRPLDPTLRTRDLFPHYAGSDKTRQCLLSRSVPRADWRYRFATSQTLQRDRAAWIFWRRGQRFSVYDEVEEKLMGEVEVASFNPLTVIPFPLVGCGLNSRGPSWDCFAKLLYSEQSIVAGFKKRSKNDPITNPFIRSSDPETRSISALARALRLVPRHPSD